MSNSDFAVAVVTRPSAGVGFAAVWIRRLQDGLLRDVADGRGGSRRRQPARHDAVVAPRRAPAAVDDDAPSHRRRIVRSVRLVVVGTSSSSTADDDDSVRRRVDDARRSPGVCDVAAHWQQRRRVETEVRVAMATVG